MCNYFSCIVTKTLAVLWLESSMSHDAIAILTEERDKALATASECEAALKTLQKELKRRENP